MTSRLKSRLLRGPLPRPRLPKLLCLKLRLQFEPRDLWIGVYWDHQPCHCSFDSCYNNKWHVYLILIPTLPLHFTWLSRSGKK